MTRYLYQSAQVTVLSPQNDQIDLTFLKIMLSFSSTKENAPYVFDKSILKYSAKNLPLQQLPSNRGFTKTKHKNVPFQHF